MLEPGKFNIRTILFPFLGPIWIPVRVNLNLFLAEFRIRIHKTFDDMDPDPVANPIQIMGKSFFLSPKILHFEIFYFYPNQTKFSDQQNNTCRVYNAENIEFDGYCSTGRTKFKSVL